MMTWKLNFTPLTHTDTTVYVIFGNDQLLKQKINIFSSFNSDQKNEEENVYYALLEFIISVQANYLGGVGREWREKKGSQQSIRSTIHPLQNACSMMI